SERKNFPRNLLNRAVTEVLHDFERLGNVRPRICSEVRRVAGGVKITRPVPQLAECPSQWRIGTLSKEPRPPLVESDEIEQVNHLGRLPEAFQLLRPKPG